MGEGLKRARAAARATRKPIVTSFEEYVVDGGRVADEMTRAGRIDLVGDKLQSDARRAVTLYVPASELVFYPIGSKIRVTVERLK